MNTERFKLTSQGTEKARKRLTALFAILSDDDLTLRAMHDEPKRTWTAEDLTNELSSSSDTILGDRIAFFTRVLERLERRGLVESVQE